MKKTSRYFKYRTLAWLTTEILDLRVFMYFTDFMFTKIKLVSFCQKKQNAESRFRSFFRQVRVLRGVSWWKTRFFFAKLVWNEKTKQKQPDILETVEKMKLWFLMQSVLNSRFLPEVLADWVELGSQSQRGNTTWKNKILQKRPFQAGWKRCRVTDNPFGCNWWNKMFDNKVLHHCQYFTVIILYFGILPLLCTCNFGIPSLLAKIAWTCRCQALTKRWTLNIEWVRQKRWKTSDTSKTGKTHRIQRRNLRKLRKLVYVWRLGIFCEV